ncbi:hypothetical protein niasHT_020311 [Heterodera trifolii]|uniref:Uncharacterized protein n=1 Tax=Heterodera trifolii TaxID=157864 RepID=A0ABD2JQQ8_9BILA
MKFTKCHRFALLLSMFVGSMVVQRHSQCNAYLPVAQTDWSAQKFTPRNVHHSWYVSFDECEPWCRAHCATKRTPDFCFLSGPCMRNCYKIVSNYMQSTLFRQKRRK